MSTYFKVGCQVEFVRVNFEEFEKFVPYPSGIHGDHVLEFLKILFTINM